MNTVYVIGDSTADDNSPPFRGWGWALPAYVSPGVTVSNHALSGRSSRSFWEEGLFEPVLSAMSAGDLLLIQFGHNDEKDDARHTDPETTYKEHLRRYCHLAMEKRTQPVLITPVARRFFTGDGSLMYTHGEYPRAVRALAEEERIPLCDLKQDSRALYLRLGQADAARLFVRLAPGEHPDFPDGHDDRTHFCANGARVIAALVAKELLAVPCCARFIRPDIPLPEEIRV